MTITLQTYCMLCVAAWFGFALYFFRKDIFRRNRPATTEATGSGPAGVHTDDDIIGRPQTVITGEQVVLPNPARPSSEELDVEYDYDPADLEALQAQAAEVPAVELTGDGGTTDWDTIDRHIMDLHQQTEEETQELLNETATSFKQLSFAFDASASPCRSLEDDRQAGATLKDISRTDMFEQNYRANMRRVDEILASVSCRVVRMDNGELDVAAKEETDGGALPKEDTDAETLSENGPWETPDETETGTSFIEDFIN